MRYFKSLKMNKKSRAGINGYFYIKKPFILMGMNFSIRITNPYPTKHLCILVPKPFWHLICINFLQCSGSDYALNFVLFWIKLHKIRC